MTMPSCLSMHIPLSERAHPIQPFRGSPMTRLRLIASTSATDLTAGSDQKSPPKGFAPPGGRGRGLPFRGRIVLPAPPERDAMLVWWSGLLMRHCGSAHEIARLFDVTEQTGRNWLDGVSCPTGLAVLHAMLLWPGAFAALVDDGGDVRRLADG